jgi:hypothetical protein
METIRCFRISFLILASLPLTVACDREAPSEPDATVISENCQSYAKDGLALCHPRHWSLAYDETDSLYANRDVSFNPSDFSKVSVLIYNEGIGDEVAIADKFARILKLKTSKNVENYRRSKVEITGLNGVRLSWRNTLLDPVSVEMTIVKIGDSPSPFFAVFNLTDEDIDKESIYIPSFIKSISLQSFIKE